MPNIFSDVTGNSLLSSLPPVGNKKGTFFGIGMVGYPTSSTVCV